MGVEPTKKVERDGTVGAAATGNAQSSARARGSNHRQGRGGRPSFCADGYRIRWWAYCRLAFRGAATANLLRRLSMRFLLLIHSFNSLSQRFYVELTERGHEVSVEFDINDVVTRDAIER